MNSVSQLPTLHQRSPPHSSATPIQAPISQAHTWVAVLFSSSPTSWMLNGQLPHFQTSPGNSFTRHADQSHQKCQASLKHDETHSELMHHSGVCLLQWQDVAEYDVTIKAFVRKLLGQCGRCCATWHWYLLCCQEPVTFKCCSHRWSQVDFGCFCSRVEKRCYSFCLDSLMPKMVWFNPQSQPLSHYHMPTGWLIQVCVAQTSPALLARARGVY